jgi:hypothetical protein
MIMENTTNLTHIILFAPGAVVAAFADDSLRLLF